MSHVTQRRALRALHGTRCHYFFAATLSLILSACGSTNAGAAQPEASGTLRIGNQAALNGTRYLLEARFYLTGGETLPLDVGYTDSGLQLQLAPGAYALEIQPGFQVLRDAAIAEVPVAAELRSDPTQDIEIVSDATTLASYQFAIDGQLVSFAAK